MTYFQIIIYVGWLTILKLIHWRGFICLSLREDFSLDNLRNAGVNVFHSKLQYNSMHRNRLNGSIPVQVYYLDNLFFCRDLDRMRCVLCNNAIVTQGLSVTAGARTFTATFCATVNAGFLLP
jgi:hypothetical protein